MSHVVIIKIQVKNLEALKEACKAIGMEFVEGQKKYRWWGHSVGDYPLPVGFTAQDLGKCDHAIRIPGNNQAYEIGVCKNKDGSEGYQLLWDFYAGGYGLEKAVGKGCDKLIKEYTKSVTRIEVKKLASTGGYQWNEKYNEETSETEFTLKKY